MRYPFGKYDQAFVPEFNAGAMENPGLRDVPRRVHLPVRGDRQPSASCGPWSIAHEMAHMWFGDLVTMRWWDDLWLNESFAEYMGYRVTAEATRFTGAWTDFAHRPQGLGLRAPTSGRRPTRSRRSDVADTAPALLNFDGISYAKGASVLRQLVAWLGDEVFLAGLRATSRAHAFGNATLADLLAALSAGGRAGPERLGRACGCAGPRSTRCAPR